MSDVATPLVSVIIPTYNHGCYLGRALQSILDQTYTNWEAIIVDNHSTDNTDEVMVRFSDPRITFLKIHNNGVIAASRNAGVLAAKGEWIAFLDSDDWWAHEKIERVAKYFAAYDCIYHEMYLIKDEKQIFNFRKTFCRSLTDNPYFDLLENGNSIINSGMIVRKSALEKIGYLNESPEVIAWEDYDGWLRLAKHGYKFKKEKSILGYYWIGGGNVSNPLRMLSIIDIFLKKYQNELMSLGIKIPPWWCSYALAINLELLGRTIEAHQSFLQAYASSNTLLQKTKITLRDLRLLIKYNLFSGLIK